MFLKPGYQMIIFTISGLVLVCILIGLLVPSSALADVGVQPILPGAAISSLRETPIQMVAEKVVMNVRSATEADNTVIKLNPEAYGLQSQPVWFTAIAEVQADFTMKNPTSDGSEHDRLVPAGLRP